MIDLAWLRGAKVWPVEKDPSQIDQILANLCVNLRDAIGDRGKVTSETRNISFDEGYCSEHAGVIPGECDKSILKLGKRMLKVLGCVALFANGPEECY